MASVARKRMTLAEFLDWDDGTDRRYQLVSGIALMMAPAAEAHGELALALGAKIRARLKTPCRIIGEGGLAIPDRADTFYVADLVVTCAPRAPSRCMVAEPVLVVEVLSPSTSRVDRLRKVADYRSLPSVQEIVLLSADERRVEVQRRMADGWRVEDLISQAELDLACCNATIPLETIYRDLFVHEIGAGSSNVVF
jgi:Uma2 family endonuclease